jgi:Amt family ammonium transporter
LFLFLTCFALLSAAALAQDPAAADGATEKAPAAPTVESAMEAISAKAVAIDTVWVMVTAFLVMWMQAGFALVETGLTRAKNAVNICMKNLLDYGFGSIAFLVIGFGLMFGGPSDSSISPMSEYVGQDGLWFLSGADNSPATGDAYVGDYGPINWTGVPLYAKFFFQLVFAATAATIVSGAMAERTKFASYMAYSVFISALIYPISGHWIWGGGWLADKGFWDFAGSTVVHSVGGWLALVGAFVLGPRKGKFDADGNPRAIPGHNLVLVTLGVFILWLGWFGFNPGSTMGTGDANLIALITVNTNTAAAVACIAALITAKFMFGKWEATMALNGALAGLVAITCPCAWVSPASSMIIGAGAGVLVVLSVVGIERILKIDDPVGAISVHGVCGAFGTLCLGLFAIKPESAPEGYLGPEAGLFTGGDATQLINQAIGVLSVFGWCIVTGAICFYGIKGIMGLRVSEAEEAEGLDFGEHGNEAYHGFQFVDH